MGMTNKRAGKLLLALCERMGIRETDEQQGRMQMKARIPLLSHLGTLQQTPQLMSASQRGSRHGARMCTQP
jgi:hypothetical protein